MKTTFRVICVFAFILGVYCYFSPLPSMHARYRCFYRYEALGQSAGRSAEVGLSQEQLKELTPTIAEAYKSSAGDGYAMARQYAVLHVVSVVLCALLLLAGLLGLRAVSTIGKGAP